MTGRATSPGTAPKTRGKALRLHGTIARKLGILIVSGKYRPGDLLGGEITSAEQLAVSRTAYREAVRILAAKGLVDARPKVGTRINARNMWHLLDPDVLGSVKACCLHAGAPLARYRRKITRAAWARP